MISQQPNPWLLEWDSMNKNVWFSFSDSTTDIPGDLKGKHCFPYLVQRDLLAQSKDTQISQLSCGMADAATRHQTHQAPVSRTHATVPAN